MIRQLTRLRKTRREWQSAGAPPDESDPHIVALAPQPSGATRRALRGDWQFRWAGVGITAAIAIAIYFLNHTSLHLAYPGPLLLLGVVFSAFAGGYIPGLVSVGVTMLYMVVQLERPSHILQFSNDAIARITIIFVVAMSITILVGQLRRLLDAAAAERERLLVAQERVAARVQALRDANLRMDEFMQVAAHELRTPLAGIKLNVQLLERLAHEATSETALYQREQQAIRRAEQQVVRMERLAQDMLDASRIQEGRLTLRTEHIDLRAVVEAAVESIRTHWPDRKLSLDVPEQPVPVQVDAIRVGQVVVNYLLNALKFSSEEQPVEVSLTTETDRARVAVRDFGVGVADDEQQLIWDRFFRSEQRTPQSGSGVGMGLGLYISRSLIEQHGGTVGLQKPPDGGTVFWFTIPLDTAPLPAST